MLKRWLRPALCRSRRRRQANGCEPCVRVCCVSWKLLFACSRMAVVVVSMEARQCRCVS